MITGIQHGNKSLEWRGGCSLGLQGIPQAASWISVICWSLQDNWVWDLNRIGNEIPMDAIDSSPFSLSR